MTCSAILNAQRAIEEIEHGDLEAAEKFLQLSGADVKAQKEHPKKKKIEEKIISSDVPKKRIAWGRVILGAIVFSIVAGSYFMRPTSIAQAAPVPADDPAVQGVTEDGGRDAREHN